MLRDSVDPADRDLKDEPRHHREYLMTDAFVETNGGSELPPLQPLKELPYLTANLPGIGGQWKENPEDFVVEEIPAYEPVDAGEHLFLWIEKRDVAAADLVRHIGRTLKIPPGDIGVAGMKDRRAVTRQYVSIPAKFAAGVEQLNTESIRVLKSARHGNKLRTGHLHGNRFSILIRDVVEEDAAARAAAIANRIRQFGFPNYYGQQRFGHNGETLQLGLDLLSGRRRSRDIPEPQRRFLRRLALSAVQSDLFNHALTSRLTDGLLNKVLVGDLMEVVPSGGKFIAEDLAAEQPRYDAGQTAVTGPMFGPKMRDPSGEPFEREQELLERSGLLPEHFAKFLNLMAGTRRAYVVRPGELAVTAEPDGLRFEFSLPSGSYATVLLREFMKSSEVTLAPESDEESVE